MILGMDVLGTVPALGIDFERQDVYVAGVTGATGNWMDVMRGALGDQQIKK